ncbi:MAG: hypothetical protein EOM19_06965, partial [Candidatus Moranbacteria bacterium]|nr:hypothetical protein [Candidatus Moranbacteria bacterium]
MTPVIADGGKGGFTFTFAFDDNLSAGSALYKKGSGFYNEPIKYTNDFGFFNKLWFGMGTSYVATDTFTDINETDESQFNEEHKYPLVVDGDSNYLGQSFLIHAGSADEDEPSHNPLIVKKDASSNYNFSYQVAVLPFRQNEYVIGQSFFTSNSLVFDISNSKDVYLYRYTDGTTYGLFDDLVLKDTTYATPVFLSQLNTNLSNGVFTFTGGAIVSSSTHTSWAIADEDGNLYLACNYPYNGVKFALRHYRDEILNIGNKPQGSNEYAVITKTVELTSITNFDLEYTRSQEGLRQALLDIETAFATEYTRTLTESQSAQDLNATTTFDIIYSRTQGELAEGLDIIGDYREWVSADEGNYNTSDYQVTLSGTFATQPELLSACYSQLDISSVNIYTVVRGESAIPGNYFYAKIYSTPQVTFDIEYEVTTQVISESAMRLFGASNEDEYTSAPPAIRTTITGTYSTQLEMIQGAYSQLDIEAINISTIIRGESSTSGVYFYCKIIHTITTTFDLEYQKQVFGEFELPELQIATSIDIENTRTAEEWEYIGTSSATYNATYAGGNSGTFS